MKRWYAAIDLKSFYASVECVERGLDPLTTHLVVADESRTDKTICLAVAPALKDLGVSGRPRLFEVKQQVERINAWRKLEAKRNLLGESANDLELKSNSVLALKPIIVPPRMALYMSYSRQIYERYLQYIAPADIFPYSVDEVFIDLTPYLRIKGMTPEELTRFLINDVFHTTGITATAGIGTNLYLAKIAMDIHAKKMAPNENGVRLAILDERTYRRELWHHRPLTDFWRIGKGTAKRLESMGLYTMGDIARCSIGKENDYYNEDLLYKTFGVNAELLIDHAWGYEPCTIADVKAYKPENQSMNSGQVLMSPYSAEKARIVLCEMAENMALSLVKKHLVCDQIVLTVGYDVESIKDNKPYAGEIQVDRYGRAIPKPAHGTINLNGFSSSSSKIMDSALTLYDRIVDQELLIRRLTLTLNHVSVDDDKLLNRQQQLFSDMSTEEIEAEKKERSLQETVLGLKQKFGNNAVIRGISLEKGATAIERNNQIGGHKA